MDGLTLVVIAFEIAVMVFSISLHDMAQAWMAGRKGDPTARMMGRLTLNPVAHFDPWGMALMPLISLFVFMNPFPLAWSAPVPMTFRNFKSKQDENSAILAGTTAQLLAAVVALVLLVVIKHTVPGAVESVGDLVMLTIARTPVHDLSALPAVFPLELLLYLFGMMNLLLSTLNLLPMPFLDGGKLLENYLPYNAAKAFANAQTWLSIAFFFVAYPLTMAVFKPMLVLFTGLLDRL